MLRPSPVYTADGVLAPADPVFDPFWARVNESGITVVVHAGDTGYSLQGYAPEKGFSASFSGGFRPNLGALHIGIEAISSILPPLARKARPHHSG